LPKSATTESAKHVLQKRCATFALFLMFWGQNGGKSWGKLGGKLGTEMYPGQDGQLPLPVALPLLRRALLYSSQCAHFIAD